MQTKTLAPSLGLLTLLAPSALQAAQQSKPLNVILIVTDDQGYGDVGYTGNPYINTPELDNLSAQSTIFDNFHTGTTSAPTRSGLMTGKYGNSTGVWHTIGGRSLLDLEEYTMAEAFEDSGYATAHFGKWHLGDNYPYRPMDRGFQEGLWHKGGGVGQTPDYYNNTYFEDTYFRGADPEKQTGYCTDIFFNETEKFIANSKEADKPFFCYLALNAPHGPYHVDERYAAPYRNNPNITNPEFYGMISNIDDNVGKLRSFLSRMELEENTVIIFFGDNGTAAGVSFDRATNELKKGYNGNLRGTKSQVYDGGHRQAMLVHIPGEAAAKSDELTAYIDIMPTLIELCGLTPERSVEFDGVNILDDDFSAKGRVFVNDTQRDEALVEDKQYCVARDEWRLISGKELYNMSNDRIQKNNVADKYPEIVSELTAEYKKWWEKTSCRKDQIQYIPIVIEESESVTLVCHDLHDDQNRPNIWNFDMLHTTQKPAPGWWSISLDKAQKLTVDAFRWSPESGIGLGAPAPEGRPIPNGVRYPAGAAIDDMATLSVKIDGEVVASTDQIDLSKPSATIEGVKLPAGEYDIQVLFADKDGVEYSAWYVNFTR